MKHTQYFLFIRQRPDRAIIKEEWILDTIKKPIKTEIQTDGRIMKIRYFADTDTALFEFSNKPVAETREIAESLYFDLDEKGNLVTMTVERAKKQANISELIFLQMEKSSA